MTEIANIKYKVVGLDAISLKNNKNENPELTIFTTSILITNHLETAQSVRDEEIKKNIYNKVLITIIF